MKIEGKQERVEMGDKPHIKQVWKLNKLIKIGRYGMNRKIAIIKNMIHEVAKQSKLVFIYSVIICLVTYGMTPIISEVYYRLIHYVVSSKQIIFEQIAFLLFIVMIASAIERVSSFNNLLLFEKFQVKVGIDLMKKVYIKTQKIPNILFNKNEYVSKVERMALYSQDSMLTQNTVHILAVIGRIISILIYLGVLAKTGVIYFVLILSISIITNLYNFNVGEKRWKLEKDLEKQVIHKNKLADLLISKNVVYELKINNFLDFILNKWSKVDQEIFKKQSEFEFKTRLQEMLYKIIQVILKMIPPSIAIINVCKGNLSFSLCFLVWQSNEQIGRLVNGIFSEWKQVYYNVEYIAEVFDYIFDKDDVNKNDDVISSDKALEPNDEPVIELENISFSYDDNLVLDDISFKVKEGEKIALVGENGSGKSTLVKIMSGLYAPDSGLVKQYGTDINKVDNKHNKIGVIWQDYFNIELSLKESIGLGDLDNLNNVEMIINVLDKIGLHNKYKLEAVIGKSFDEEGIIPSGGEYQRIAIGRAIFGEKFCIFMDEPTANLDPIAEVSIFNEVSNMFENKAIIFVSHRIGFARLADKIIYLQDSKIVEQGTHNELILQSGLYKRMYETQAQWLV